ncbi:MAG: XrtA system polysaccharide deacetylase, partial [Candidatus Omnitrophota bacterium]
GVVRGREPAPTYVLTKEVIIMEVTNILTIDVEDYFQVENFKKVVAFSDWGKYENRVERNTGKVLEILADAGVRGTFFVLGWTAEKFPGVVRRIHEAGHEIASHGYAHDPVFTLTPDSFRDDVVKSKKILEDITREPVLGYRAPTFSLTEKSLWALDVLVEEGFMYDSSVLPVCRRTRGLAGAERYPYKIRNGEGVLWEFPVSTVRVFGRNLAFAGGGYFRLYPYPFVKGCIAGMNRENRPAVVYVHPWEVDPAQPRIKAGLASGFKHYVNLSRTEGKLRELLNDFGFGPVKEVFGDELGLKTGVGV